MGSFVFCRQDPNSRAVLHAIESVVIECSHQINDAVDKDSAKPLLRGLHPDPQTELNFWTTRKDNLLYINYQVSDFRCYCKHQGELSLHLPLPIHSEK